MNIVMDAGPLISLSDSCLLWILRYLNKYGVRFYISGAVLRETVTHPLQIRHYKLSAERIGEEIGRSVELVGGEEVRALADEILSLANSVFVVGGRKMEIIQRGEAEGLALVTRFPDRILCVDERTTRALFEEPEVIKGRLERKTGKRAKVNREALERLYEVVGRVDFVRSVDLIGLAYELGAFDRYSDPEGVMEGAMYAVKYKGCAVGEWEIKEFVGRR